MMGEFALSYAARGWHVFPCNVLNKRPLVRRDLDAEGKETPGTGGVKKATADVDQIREWWQRWPTAMIGVACGPASGVWAIDPDAPKKPGEPDGRANWAALCLKHGCAATHTHLTPGGGKHLLFRWRPDRPITNSEGTITGTGINVRGDGGYVIAPPSKRHDGKAYEIAEPLDFFSFAEAPDWLYAMLRPKAREQARTDYRPSSRSSAHPIGRIQGILNRVASTTEGDRNKVLFWGAMRVVEMVVEKEVPPSEGDRAFAALCDAGRHAGLPENEIIRTLQSARARA
ncbi:bifunctional DNA primase/polymerase [Bradyrhizobium sp. NDS-1]|uniref:bifunctional DNA primase/polymerase n=1 Tax=Bradyrhizobium sp. NDS-1 TaxID=3080014 RepID=UPI00293F275A|nr:bifunctional DNA primase/polymerase [Bradyrhizobium sp. NDS-1]WOH70648.1 bifunctional DNA primase/polymerase [Bradyrhizobium sp. NDS-1]